MTTKKIFTKEQEARIWEIVKEAIDANRQVLNLEPTEPVKLKPDFEKWEESGVISRLTNLIIAPEDYYEGDKKLFTWHEAMALDLPDGWRLPTSKEWLQICAEFGAKDDGYSPEAIQAKLWLDLNGWQASDSSGVSNQGSYGHWWSSTASSGTSAYNLLLYTTSVYPQYNDYKYYGFSVRCVKEAEDEVAK